jgi:glycosyltransferase
LAGGSLGMDDGAWVRQAARPAMEAASPPRVSIITVVRNAARTVGATVTSVATQTIRAQIEHVVVDGVSTDGTLEVLAAAAWPGLRVTSGPDQGIYDAMNQGVRRATGDWLVFINADDQLAGPEALAGALTAVRTDTTAIHAFDYCALAEGLPPVRRSPRWRPSAGMSVCHQALLYPRQVFTAVGGYDLRWRIAGDYDHLLRCHLAGVPVRHHPHLLSSFSLEGATSRYMHRCFDESAAIARQHLGPLAAAEIRLRHAAATGRKAAGWVAGRLGGAGLRHRLRSWWLTRSGG